MGESNQKAMELRAPDQKTRDRWVQSLRLNIAEFKDGDWEERQKKTKLTPVAEDKMTGAPVYEDKEDAWTRTEEIERTTRTPAASMSQPRMLALSISGGHGGLKDPLLRDEKKAGCCDCLFGPKK
eukprot:TRINITY_DN6244_c0_g1_i1.p1 TRINITY_DN6244_c0_g1~~TRINITY_DN6244_c0_g1_i1.p1  ORF type:complete len:125 (-),score=26.99 TRINITY_DN6244_c0_g1_i1:144-518(-)